MLYVYAEVSSILINPCPSAWNCGLKKHVNRFTSLCNSLHIFTDMSSDLPSIFPAPFPYRLDIRIKNYKSGILHDSCRVILHTWFPTGFMGKGFAHREKRIHGKSRWTFSKKVNAFMDSIFGYSVAPLRIFSLIGTFVSSISFIYGAWMVCNAILKKTAVPGFATIVVLISFLMGLVIIMLSVIGEYLWRIADEVNKRPEVVIEKIY